VRADPVTIGLAIGSTIAGLIASSNRSDGGIGAMLQANLQYQRILTEQLVSIQDALVDVMTKLNSMPDEFRRELREGRLADLHAKLGQQVLRYKHEVHVRASKFGSYQAWQSNELTRSELDDIRNNFSSVAAEVERGAWLDPLTALYLPVAAFTSLGVRTALGEQREPLKAEAQRFLTLLSLVEDSSQPGSTAAELVRLKDIADQQRKELLTFGYAAPIDASTAVEAQVLMGRLNIQDFTPRHITVRRPQKCSLRNRAHPDYGDGDCHDDNDWAPDRFGELEGFAYYAVIKPSVVSNPGAKGTGSIEIQQLRVSSELSTKSVAATAAAPTGKQVAVERVDAQTREARMASAQKLPPYDIAKANRELFERAVLRYNQTLVLIAIGASALVAAATCKRALLHTFEATA
jgi:hypothetical protein